MNRTRRADRALICALAASAALHGAALCWAWGEAEPPVRRPASQDLVLTSLRARIAPSAPAPAAKPTPSSAAQALFKEAIDAPKEASSLAAASQAGPAALGSPSPENAPARAAPEPLGPDASVDRPLASDVQWPDFSVLGPGTFEVEIAFGASGAPQDLRLRFSTFDDETNARLVAMLREARSPKPGEVALEFTIDPPKPD